MARDLCRRSAVPAKETYLLRTAVTQRMAQVFEDRWIKTCMIVLDDTGNATHNAVAFHSVLYTPGLS
jgi:hypothetical protein